MTNVYTPVFGDTWINPNMPEDQSLYWVGATFTAIPIGLWSSNLDHEWNAAGQVFTDTWYASYPSITPTGSAWWFTTAQYEQLGMSGPQTLKVNLTLTDEGNNDDSQSAVYNLRVHNQFDDWLLAGPTYVMNPVYLVPTYSGVATVDTDVTCSWTQYGAMWTDMDTAGLGVIGVLLFADPLYAAGFVLAGVTLAECEGQSGSISVNFNDCWDNGYSSIDGSWSDPMGAYQMTPALASLYTAVPETADTWGANGYTGLTPNVVAKLWQEIWSGNFTPLQ